MTTKTKVTVTIPTKIDLERVQDLLVGAWEGGSNYWYCELEILTDMEDQCPKDGYSRFHVIPTLEGTDENGERILGTVGFKDQFGDFGPLTLDLDKVKKGLEVFATKVPHQWANFINENDDSFRADYVT